MKLATMAVVAAATPNRMVECSDAQALHSSHTEVVLVGSVGSIGSVPGFEGCSILTSSCGPSLDPFPKNCHIDSIVPCFLVRASKNDVAIIPCRSNFFMI